MQRSRKILVVCHCLLNANAKVPPLAAYPGALLPTLLPFMEQGVGLVQLPCPETCHCGLLRWGMTREQYDHSAFRRACREMLRPVVDTLDASVRSGCEVLAVVGMDGSPNCGVFATCEGYRGGEAAAPQTNLQEQLAGARLVPGSGVFMDVLAAMLRGQGMDIPFWAVDEKCPAEIKTARS